jgi:hypothetical protein
VNYLNNFVSLFPKDEELDDWQQAIKRAIFQIQRNRTPYNWGPDRNGNEHSGCTKDIFFRNQRIMEAGTPPGSYCCGATMEAFMLAWSFYMVGFEEDNITVEQMEELYKYFFVYKSFDDKYIKGCAGGIQALDQEYVDWLLTAYSEDPDEYPFGTFLQMRFEPDPYGRGHSAIVIGHGTYNDDDGEDKDVLIVWSSNYGYHHRLKRQGKEYLVKDASALPSGHELDFYYKEKTYHLDSGKFDRKFFGAWIIGE